MLEDLVRRLSVSLQGTLPGSQAHLRMAPRPRPGWRPAWIPDGARPGAALALWLPLPTGEPALLLTLRPRSMQAHGGQVSLPGGTVEPGETPEEAALREAREEVGVEPATVRLIGRLSPLYIPVSHFRLQPVVGWMDRTPDLRPQPSEVERILTPSWSELVDPGRVVVEQRRTQWGPMRVPALQLEGARLWGATAMVVSELLWAAGRPPEVPWETDAARDGGSGPSRRHEP